MPQRPQRQSLNPCVFSLRYLYLVKCVLDEGGRGLKLFKINSKDANTMLCHVVMISDFFTNSYGESWDSSCVKS